MTTGKMNKLYPTHEDSCILNNPCWIAKSEDSCTCFVNNREENSMSWKHRTIIRILLFIAKMLGDDLPSRVRQELDVLVTHIILWKGKDGED